MRRFFFFAIGTLLVSTPATATADVVARPDGTRFETAPGTTISPPTEENTTTLSAGAVRARTPDDGRKTIKIRVTTEAALVTVTQGDAKVSVDDAKTTRVAVHRGSASVASSGGAKKTVEVADGFGVRVPKGGAPSKPTPLPVAPAWTGPARRTVLVAEPSADLSIAFEPLTVPGMPAAASWHVQLAKDHAFDSVVVDRAMPLGDRRLDAKGLAAGTYHGRASAIDVDGLEGKWSTTVRVDVVRANVEPVAGGRLRVSLEPASAAAQCKLDGAPTTFPIDTDRDRPHEITCGEGALAKLPLAPRALGGVRITSTASATGPQSGSLKIVIVDQSGQPVDRLKPIAMTPSDLAIAPLVATGGPGEYVATYNFIGAPHTTAVKLRLRDDYVADAGTIAFESIRAPDAPAPSVPTIEEGRKKGGLEIGAGGLASWRGKPPIGVGFEGELRGAFAMPHGALFIGVAGGWSKLLESTREGLPVEGTAVHVRALIGYRFGTGVVAPYVQLGPEVVRQWVRIPGFEGREWLAGASGGLGLDVEAGPGAFFIEVRGRAVAPAVEDEPSLTASGGLGLLGYRLRL